MTASMAASHAADKILKDAIFGANAACREAAEKYGAANVTNATIGVLMDEDEKLACLKTVEAVYREIPMTELAAYAPISGLPDYLDAAVGLALGEKPACFSAAVASAGGTGAIHHAIENYAEKNQTVLTGDWFWGTYKVICREVGSRLETFKLFDERQNFNLNDFSAKTAEILSGQDSILIILNTPAHNPTGYNLSDEDWDGVLDVLKNHAAKGKKINLLVDIAYIDYAGPKRETRKFMAKFHSLPKNIFVMVAFSMSKSYTFYGQRTGALIGLSSSREVIEEFSRVCQYSSRATWSNINRGAMLLLTRIQNDAAALAAFERERGELYDLVQKRAAVFMTEAAECGLNVLPYKGGFFISVPAADPVAVCENLKKELVFAVPLGLGVRIAACSVSLKKMPGVAKKTLAALNESLKK